MAAAPVTGILGAAVAPAAAQAATINAGQYVLTVRDYPDPARTADTFTAITSELVPNMTKVGVTDILASVNRSAVHLSAAPHSAANFVDGFTWDTADQAVTYWVPQGVTTTADAYGDGMYPSSGTNRVVLASWRYDTTQAQDDANNPPTTVNGVQTYTNKGVRISFVDYNTASAPKYRHVLLVEPVRTASGAASYKPIAIHAGGVMWYGTMLYVVDTYKGLRVFDLESMLESDPTDGTSCGLGPDGTTYSAFGYSYVLPQTHAYDNTGTYLRYTTLGLDRSTTPDSLVVSEYSLSGQVDYSSTSFIGTGPGSTTPKVVRWDLDYTTRLLSDPDSGGNVAAGQAVTIAQEKIQGVVSQGTTVYLSTSDGTAAAGSLRRYVGTSTTPASSAQAIGPEDLSFHADSAGWAYSADAVWTLTEYYSGEYANAGRYVYAVSVPTPSSS